MPDLGELAGQFGGGLPGAPDDSPASAPLIGPMLGLRPLILARFVSTLNSKKVPSMAVKLRLTRVGKTKQPQYRIVAADSRSPRDGRFIEIVGHYNPRTEPSTHHGRQREGREVAEQGAQPTDRVRKLLEISGALERVRRRPRPSAASTRHERRRHRSTADDDTTGDAPTAAAVLTHIVTSIVDDPDAVRVDTLRQTVASVRLDVRVGPGDLGRVIGRRGRTAQSIRTVVRAAADPRRRRRRRRVPRRLSRPCPGGRAARTACSRSDTSGGPTACAARSTSQLATDRPERVATGSPLVRPWTAG